MKTVTQCSPTLTSLWGPFMHLKSLCFEISATSGDLKSALKCLVSLATSRKTYSIRYTLQDTKIKIHAVKLATILAFHLDMRVRMDKLGPLGKQKTFGSCATYLVLGNCCPCNVVSPQLIASYYMLRSTVAMLKLCHALNKTAAEDYHWLSKHWFPVDVESPVTGEWGTKED